MCVEMEVPLLSQIPLEPKLLLACESGQCFAHAYPESVTGKKFLEIATKIYSMK
jgi:nitrogenase subunit NifH